MKMNLGEMLAKMRAANRQQQPGTERMTKVFDWNMAAAILGQRRIMYAECGLDEDWSYTADVLIENGIPNRFCGAYLHSFWATPVIKLADGETIPCWREVPASNKTYADAIWPESAMSILFPPELSGGNPVLLLEKPKSDESTG